MLRSAANRSGSLAWCGVAIVVVLVLAAGPAVAAVLLVDDQRRISYDVGSGQTIIEPSAPFADFSAGGFGLSSQVSQVSTGTMTASGTGSLNEGDPTESGGSIFQIDFEVTSDTLVLLNGELDILGGDGPGSASVQLTSLSPSSTLFFWGADGPFSHSSVLPPGQYRIRAGAAGSISEPNSDAGFDLQLDLATLVPTLAPAASLLLALGLGVVPLALRRSAARR